MSNIEKRVHELKEKDRIEKEIELKQVYEFWELIKEDLIVSIIYNIDKSGKLSFYGSTYDDEGLLTSIMRKTEVVSSSEVVFENISQIMSFSYFQKKELTLLVYSELERNKLKLDEDRNHHILNSYEIKRISSTDNPKPVVEFKKPEAETPFVNGIVVGLLIVMFVALIIGVTSSC